MTLYRAIFRTLVAALAVLLLFSCGKDKHSTSGPRTINDSITDTIHIVQIIPKKAVDDPYARIGFDCGDWSGVEFEYPAFGKQKIDVYQIADIRNRRVYLVTAADKGITITQFDGSKDYFDWGQQVFSATVNGGTLHCAQLTCQGNDESGEPYFAVEMVSDVQLSASTKTAGVVTKGQTEDSIRKSFYELFEEIGSGWDKLGSYLGGSASEICSFLKDVVIPLGQLNLYADDVDALQRLMKEKQREVTVQGVQGVLVQIIGSDSIDYAWNMYDMVLDCAHIINEAWNHRNDLYERMTRVVNVAPKMKKATAQAATAKLEYEPSITVVNKTAESVSVKADATALVSNPSALYYVEFHAYLDGREVAASTDWEAPFEWSLNNIGGGGSYIICARLYTESGLSYNASVVVQMPHYFQVEPAFVKMGVEGGDASLTVTVPDESTWSWEVTEKPSWVTITGIGKRTLTIKIAPGSAERNGDMRIEATDGTEVKQQIVPIVQSGSGWDGTAWSVKPTLSISMSGRDADHVEYGGGLNYIEFMITDAAAGGFKSNIPWNSMRASGKTLVFNYRSSQTASDGMGATYTLTDNVSMTVTRTDDTHASVTVRGTGTYSGAAQATCTANGSGVATRIR